jgi:hypothetical protein
MVNLEVFRDKDDTQLSVSKYYEPKDKDLLDLLSRLYENNLQCEFSIHWIQTVPHKSKQLGKDGNIVWLDLGVHKTCTLSIKINHDVDGPINKTPIGDIAVHPRKTIKLWNIGYERIQRIIMEVITPPNSGDDFVGNGSHE